MPSVVVFVTVPLGLAFGDRFERHFVTADLTIDSIFLFDVFLNFITGFRPDGSDDYVEMRPKEIAKNYLKSWFVLDVISCPSVILLLITGIPYASELSVLKVLKGGKVLKMLKMVKMLKMLRITKMMGAYALQMEEFFMRSTARVYIRLAHLLALVTLSGHLLACFWLAVSEATDDKISWMYAYRDGLDDDGVGSEYQSSIYVEWDLVEQYVTAMYFAITTMSTVGFGDICPSSTGERLFMIAAMVLGGGVYGFIIGSLASVVTDQDTNKKIFYERMDMIHSYMHHRKFSPDLRHKIHRHFRKFFEVNSALDEKAIFNDLSDALRVEVMAAITNSSVSLNYLFRGVPTEEIGRLSMMLKPSEVASSYGPVIESGTTGTVMFIITAGTALCYRKPVTESEKLRANEHGFLHCKLVSGDCFGEMACLGLDPTYIATVVCATHLEDLEMLMLAREDFLTAFPSNSELWNLCRDRAIEHSMKNYLTPQGRLGKKQSLKTIMSHAGENGYGLNFDAETYRRERSAQQAASVLLVMQKKTLPKRQSFGTWRNSFVAAGEEKKESGPMVLASMGGGSRWATVRAAMDMPSESSAESQTETAPPLVSSASEECYKEAAAGVHRNDGRPAPSATPLASPLASFDTESTKLSIDRTGFQDSVPKQGLKSTFDDSGPDRPILGAAVRRVSVARHMKRNATLLGGGQNTLPTAFADTLFSMLENTLDDLAMVKQIQMDAIAKYELGQEKARQEAEIRMRQNEEATRDLARRMGFEQETLSPSLSPEKTREPSLLQLKVSAKWLTSKDDNGLSDPFLRIRRCDDSSGTVSAPLGTAAAAASKRSVLYQSEVVMRSLSPSWQQFGLLLSEMGANFASAAAATDPSSLSLAPPSLGGVDRNKSLTFEVWDWDRDSDDDYIGSATVYLGQLLDLKGKDTVLAVELEAASATSPLRPKLVRKRTSGSAVHNAGSLFISAMA